MPGQIKRKWGIPVATLCRWRKCWREAFPATEPWRAKRGELVMPSQEAPLHFVLQQMQGGRFGERLLWSLVWFKPRTGYCGFSDGSLQPRPTNASRRYLSPPYESAV